MPIALHYRVIEHQMTRLSFYVKSRRVTSTECVNCFYNFEQTFRLCFWQHNVTYFSRKTEMEISTFGGRKATFCPRTEVLYAIILMILNAVSMYWQNCCRFRYIILQSHTLFLQSRWKKKENFSSRSWRKIRHFFLSFFTSKFNLSDFFLKHCYT